MTVKDALIIGAFQALAPVFPGISRSGATISAGILHVGQRILPLPHVISVLLSIEIRRRTNPVPAASSACTIGGAATPWGKRRLTSR